jgi:bifunctional non-homologous end joining protein LigD
MNLPVLPMLATAAAPFDSDAYLFEVKWDGVRALAAVDGGRWQLWGRGRADYGGRYPELAVLRGLPAGTVVDGELVQFRDGRADLPALLRRHHLQHPEAIARASRVAPVCYLVFDLLACQGQPLLAQPLARRRAALAELVAAARAPRLVFSDGVVGAGRAFFDQVVAQGHEGVLAKHLASRYWPGRRSPAWRKIKPRQVLPCVVIGYTPAPEGLRSLLVATVRAGALRYVARLTRGLGPAVQADLARRLAQRPRPGPVVPCPHRARWVEPELYCRVPCFGWTAHGRLRHAAFGGLLADSG